MDAFSALSANLVQTAPSTPVNAPSSSSSNKAFASHLQSATKQHRAGQRSEPPAPQAEAQVGQLQTEQTADAAVNQPPPAQSEQANREPVETDNSATATDATTTAGAMNAAPSAIPAQPVHAEATVATSSSAATATTALTRLLDAITATTPASSPTTQTAAAAGTGAQQIIVENAALPAAASSVTPPLTTTTEPLLAVMPAALPATTPQPQLPGQTVAIQDTLPTQSPPIVAPPVADAQNAVAGGSGETGLPQSDIEPGAPLVVQNQYGQIITIQQNSALAVAAEAQAQTAAQVAPFAGNTEADMDLTNQYIHSHLPNETAAKGEHSSGDRSAMNNESGQSMPQNQTPQQAEPPSATEPILAVKTLATTSQESQPLIFSHQQSSGLTSAPLSTSTTSTAESSLYRLPSGTTVPETAVIDQMITHFSINKRLESGTVNLRLHPQELGELRMEIKVEQDNVKAHIVAQSPHAQEMIDRHLPKLREALEQQGLHLDQVEVTVAANDNAAGEAFQENTAWQQSQRSLGSKQSQAVFTLEGFDEELDTTAEIDNNLSVIA